MFVVYLDSFEVTMIVGRHTHNASHTHHGADFVTLNLILLLGRVFGPYSIVVR